MQRERHYKDDKLNAAAEELWSYRERQFAIRRLQCQSKELEDRYEVGSSAYDGVRVKGGVQKDKLVEIAVAWADLQAEIARKVREAEHELWEIEARLKSLTSPQRQVLELYYIKGYSVVKIAQMMNYSEQWVRLTKHNGLNAYAYSGEN